MCPHCQCQNSLIKRGTYTRKSDNRLISRQQCRNCKRSFSETFGTVNYRLRKRGKNQIVFRLLSKSMSQRGIAQVLGVKPRTVAVRVERFGFACKKILDENLPKIKDSACVQFDEMESFEHTKLKPLTIPLAIDGDNRKILALSVGNIAAKGNLAAKSVQKYGKRVCERAKVLDKVLETLRPHLSSPVLFKTDQSVHYPARIKKIPGATHVQTKGRRGCVVGQGELKRGGLDPLFSLNHSCAMIRDNIKRLSRRTWCTTKKSCNLVHLLHIYACYHNQIIDGVRRPVITI